MILRKIKVHRTKLIYALILLLILSQLDLLPFAIGLSDALKTSEMADVTIVHPETAVITCDYGAEVTDKIHLEINSRNTTVFRGGDIQITTIDSDKTGLLEDAWMLKVYEASGTSDALVCCYTPKVVTGFFECNQVPSCLDKKLNPDTRYDFELSQSGSVRVTDASVDVYVNYDSIQLYYKNPFMASRVPLSSTTNCVMQDWGVLPNKDEDKIIRAGKSVPKSVGQTEEYWYSLRETIALDGTATTTFTKDGVDYLASCVESQRKVYGYRVFSQNNRKYAVMDGSVVFLDYTKDPKKPFTCTSTFCSSLGKGYSLNPNTFLCEKGQFSKTCPSGSDLECTNGGNTQQFVTFEDGKNVRTDYKCINKMCVETKTEVKCNPNLNPYNDMMCLSDGSGLVPKITGKILCPENKCCLDTQDFFTLRPAPKGDYCCDLNGDGVGDVTGSEAECKLFSKERVKINENNNMPALFRALRSFGNLFGGGTTSGLLIYMLIFLVLLLVIIK